MTEEEQKLYDVIADWWEDVFCAASYKGKDASLLDLVHAIMDLKYKNECDTLACADHLTDD